jgi:hypothetical protein
MEEIEKTISDDEIIRESETFKQIVQLVKEMKDPKIYGIGVGSLGAATLDYLEEISLSELKIFIARNRSSWTPQTTLSLNRLHEDTFFRVLITNVLITKSKKSVDLKTLAIANLHYLNMIEEREKQDALINPPKSIEFMTIRLNPELDCQFYLCNKSFIRWFKCSFRECDYQHIPHLNNSEKDVKDLACKYFIHFAKDEHEMGKEKILKAFKEILWIKKNKYNKLHPIIRDFIFLPTSSDNQNETEAIFNNLIKLDSEEDPTAFVNTMDQDPIELNTTEEEKKE